MTKSNIEYNVTDRGLDLLERLKDATVVLALDTETTGMSKTDQVIELALVDCDSLVPVMDELYKPTCNINKHAQAVHGIKLMDVIGKPTFNEDAAKVLVSHLTATNDGTFDEPLVIVIGWNCSFDIRLIKQTVAIHSPDYQQEELECIFEYQVVDMMEVVKELTGKKMKQSVALEYFGVEVEEQSHRALQDCLDLAALVHALFSLVEEV